MGLYRMYQMLLFCKQSLIRRSTFGVDLMCYWCSQWEDWEMLLLYQSSSQTRKQKLLGLVVRS